MTLTYFLRGKDGILLLFYNMVICLRGGGGTCFGLLKPILSFQSAFSPFPFPRQPFPEAEVRCPSTYPFPRQPFLEDRRLERVVSHPFHFHDNRSRRPEPVVEVISRGDKVMIQDDGPSWILGRFSCSSARTLTGNWHDQFPSFRLLYLI